jgi:hypothetical protein
VKVLKPTRSLRTTAEARVRRLVSEHETVVAHWLQSDTWGDVNREPSMCRVPGGAWLSPRGVAGAGT